MQERDSSEYNVSELVGGLGLEGEVRMRSAVPVLPDEVPPASPDPQGQVLHDRQLATERDIRRSEGDLRDAQDAYDAAVSATVGASLEEIDAHVATLSAAEQRITTLRQQLSMQQHRYVLLGDALFPHRQQGRGRAASRIDEQIEDLERADVELKGQIAEHLNAAQDLEREREALAHRLRPLAQEKERATLRTDRLLKVNVQLAASWRPPAGVFVKPSAWRRFIERARGAHLETVDAFVNETTGAIHSLLLDREST